MESEKEQRELECNLCLPATNLLSVSNSTSNLKKHLKLRSCSSIHNLMKDSNGFSVDRTRTHTQTHNTAGEKQDKNKTTKTSAVEESFVLNSKTNMEVGEK
ncbi:unnamed protein product [Leuciscus chuanchicus]